MATEWPHEVSFCHAILVRDIDCIRKLRLEFRFGLSCMLTFLRLKNKSTHESRMLSALTEWAKEAGYTHWDLKALSHPKIYAYVPPLTCNAADEDY